MGERSEVSRHEVQVFGALIAAPRWITNKELSAQCEGVSPRTVRAVTLKLVRLGIADQAEVFPAHRYRIADKAAQRNRGYFDRLYRAAEVFEIPLRVP